MFLKEVFYAHQSGNYLIQIQKTSILWNILLQFKIAVFYINSLFFKMSWLQSSVSHDPSEFKHDTHHSQFWGKEEEEEEEEEELIL